MSPLRNRRPVNPDPVTRRHFEHNIPVAPLGTSYARPKRKLNHTTKYFGWLEKALKGFVR